MSRPTTIDDATILDAARAVFLERGITATTAEVAARAGVSEGSVFKRFRTKDQLFRSAMDRACEGEGVSDRLAELVGKGDVKEQLLALALASIDHLRTVVPAVMLSWSNPGHSGIPSRLVEPNPPPLRVLKNVTAYFEAEMKLGRLRRHDPEIVARTFMGALWHFAFLELVFRIQEIMPLPAETFARGFVELQWPGLDPAGNAAPTPRGAP